MSQNKIFAIAAFSFFVLLLLVFNEFVFDSSKLMLNSDALNGLGSYYMRAENLILPEWDDSRLGGIPTLDAVAGSAYHPLALLRFVMDPGRAEGWIFILVIWSAFLSAFVLGRYLTDSSKWGALLGFLYAFSPQYFSFIYGGHEGKMMVFGIAPFAMYALVRLLREGSLKHLIYLTLSIVWMITSAHIQMTYFFLWGAGLYTLFELFSNKLSAKIRATRLGLASLALAIALMISALQIIPPYLYTTTDSVRGSAEKTTIEHSASWSLHAEELAAMILPGFLGTDAGGGENSYWGQNPFKLNADGVGTLLTFLALCGLLLPGNRKAAIFWFCGCLIALSYALGLHTILFNLWYNIVPGVKNFRAPSMSIFWLPLAFVFLAAPVLKNIDENKAIIKKAAMIYGILLLVLLFARYNWETVSGIVAIFLRPVEGEYFKPVDFAKAAGLASYSVTSFIIVAITVGAAIFTKKPLILAVVAAIDLAVVNMPYIQNIPAIQYYNPSHPAIQAIKKDSPNDLERPRVLSLSRNPAISGNIFAAYGMRNALGFHDNEIGTYRIFRESVQSQTMIDLANVGYIIYDDRIQKNQGDLGKAKLYYDFEQSGNVIDRLNDVNFDYRNVLLLDSPLLEGWQPKVDGVSDNIKILNVQNGKMKFEIESTANAMLFVSENFHKYWKAKVNGKDEQIYKAFGTFMAVQVSEGKSVVELEYKSDAVKISLWIGLAGLVLLLGVAFLTIKLKDKRK